MPSTPRFIFIAPTPKQDVPGYVPSLVEAWRVAVRDILGQDDHSQITVLEGKLQEIDPKLLQCDCMVSPANSFGIMDGG